MHEMGNEIGYAIVALDWIMYVLKDYSFVHHCCLDSVV